MGAALPSFSIVSYIVSGAFLLIGLIGVVFLAVEIRSLLVAMRRQREKHDDFIGSLEIKDEITVQELGQLERRIDNLTDVIVACHIIERPQGALLDAVEFNMRRGVRYTFLVSRSSYLDELENYYQFFRIIATIVTKQPGAPADVDSLVQIGRLQRDWQRHPYIFYKTRPDDHDVEATIVYRGVDQNRGICTEYQLVDPALATVVYDLLVGSIDWQGERQHRGLATRLTLTPNEFVSSHAFKSKNLKSQ